MIRKNWPEESPTITQKLAREILSSQSYLVLNKKVVARYGIIIAAVLSNLVDKQIYFENNYPENDGWFFHSHKSQAKALGISEYAVKESKNTLVDERILSTKRMGVPAKEWYFIDYIRLFSTISDDNSVIDKKSLEKVFPDPTDPTTLDPTDPTTLDPTDSGGLIKEPRIKEPKKNIFLATKTKNIEKDREAIIAIAYQLSETIQSKKNIHHTPSQILGWVPSIRALARITLKDSDEAPIRRIKRALKWYKEHIGEPYVPVIESGKSLREKFLRLEDAVVRDKGISQKQVKSPSNKYKNVKKITWGGD